MAVELIFGSKGEGKSTYMLNRIKKSLRPCIAIDTIKWSDVKTGELIFDKHMIRIERIDDFSHWTKFKLVYTPDTDLDMAIFCEHLFLYRSIDIYIDELDNWTNSKLLPRELYNVFRFSRHRDFNIYATMRDPTEIHRLIRLNSDYFIIYYVNEKGFLDYFRFYSDELPEKILALKPHEHIRHRLRQR